MGWTKRGVDRIKRLTPKQEAEIPRFAEKWNAIARSTEPYDTQSTADAMRGFLKAMGCKQPRNGFWHCSDRVKAWQIARFKWEDAEKKNPKILGIQRLSAWATRCILTHSFEPSVITAVETFMNRNVARSLRPGRIAENTNEPKAGFRSGIVFGQWDASWLAIADYFGTVFGNEHCQKFAGLMQAVASCGFVWVKHDKVIYCDRPEIAKFDDRGRLHCEDGPAIQYRDGWGYCYMSGVPVPASYSKMPADEIKIDEVLKLSSTDMRMAIIKKIGFTRLLATTRHRSISEADGNSLIEFKLGEKAPYLYLRALHLKWQDKTGEKETMLPVPRMASQFGEDCPENIHDCEQVRRWTLGWPKEAIAVAET
jgi:hypothetical protein